MNWWDLEASISRGDLLVRKAPLQGQACLRRLLHVRLQLQPLLLLLNLLSKQRIAVIRTGHIAWRCGACGGLLNGHLPYPETMNV